MVRGQASITAVEAAIGVLLLLGMTLTFALGTPTPAEDRVQLDTYASDSLTILASERPQHRGATRLAEVVVSEGTFEREKGALVRRIERILPDNVMFRIETRYGTAGHPLPAGVPTGVATTTTTHGTVTLRVWYV